LKKACKGQSSWLRQTGQPVWMMGVLNCTPDSFSDGGHFFDSSAAIKHGLSMRESGACIIDVGGESTRPRAESVSIDEELRRIIPVIEGLVKEGCFVSVDTCKAEVMRQAVLAGAGMINDVSALSDEQSLEVAAQTGVDVCLMHMQGHPANMQISPHYDNVLSDILLFFEQRIERCIQAGIEQTSLILDPGIGFGKRLQDNLILIANIDRLKDTFGLPILLGVSRKSFMGEVTGADVGNRELETAVSGTLGIFQGVDGVRVHDVGLQKRACQMAVALTDARQVS